MRRSVGFLVLMAALLAVAGISIGLKRREAGVLRGELRLAQAEADTLATLRKENQRLREEQISTSELERLRADHAALARLQGELETLRKASGGK